MKPGGAISFQLTGFPRSQNYLAIWIRPVQTAYSLKSQYPELGDIKIGHAHFAMRTALNEIDRVKNEGLTADEFELTRQFLRSYMKLYIQSPERQLGFLMDSQFYGMENYIAEMDTKLAKLTLEEVNAAAAKYLQTENMYITMITDSNEAEPLKKSLMTNASLLCLIQTLSERVWPERVFEADKKVEAYPHECEEGHHRVTCFAFRGLITSFLKMYMKNAGHARVFCFEVQYDLKLIYLIKTFFLVSPMESTYNPAGRSLSISGSSAGAAVPFRSSLLVSRLCT